MLRVSNFAVALCIALLEQVIAHLIVMLAFPHVDHLLAHCDGWEVAAGGWRENGQNLLVLHKFTLGKRVDGFAGFLKTRRIDLFHHRNDRSQVETIRSQFVGQTARLQALRLVHAAQRLCLPLFVPHVRLMNRPHLLDVTLHVVQT